MQSNTGGRMNNDSSLSNNGSISGSSHMMVFCLPILVDVHSVVYWIMGQDRPDIGCFLIIESIFQPASRSSLTISSSNE